MQSDRIDAAIDEVAGAMTAGEPGHSFTSNVMRRLPERMPVAGRWRPAFVLAPIAIATLVVVFVARSGRRTDHVEPVRSPGSAIAVSPDVRVSDSPHASVNAETAPPLKKVLSNSRRTAVAGAEAAVPERSASPIEMLTVAPIANPTLTTDPIPVDPIRVDRLDSIPLLTIAPLSADEGQNQRREP